jgi:uncharacterized protein
MNNLALALTDDELDRLDALLEQYSQREEGYDIERLDGLFASLAVCPVLVPPSRYLPVIKRDEDAESAEETPAGDDNEGGFASVEQMQDFMLLLMRHSNAVMRELRNPKKKTTDYVPIIFPDEVYETPEDAQKFMGISWALGFIDGMQMYEEAWDAAASDSPALERLEMLITSLMLSDLSDEESGDESEGGPDDDVAESATAPLTLDERLDVFAALPQALKDAAKVFAEQHQPVRKAQTVVRGEKTGRNEPCPCGSGKKYKQCCGR